MRYVVIGASAAGISGAKTLRELDNDAEIVLVSKDEHVYSRCILHHYISNQADKYVPYPLIDAKYPVFQSR